MVSGVVLYLIVFTVVMLLRHPAVTAETALIRAAGSGALVLLHVILCIGPLCRLSPRFLPLLYNRRHMGVTMFALALVHGAFAIFQYHALGDTNPFVSVIAGVPWWGVAVLLALAIGQVVTDVLWSTKSSDWSRYLREMAIAREYEP